MNNVALASIPSRSVEIMDGSRRPLYAGELGLAQCGGFQSPPFHILKKEKPSLKVYFIIRVSKKLIKRTGGYLRDFIPFSYCHFACRETFHIGIAGHLQQVKYIILIRA